MPDSQQGVQPTPKLRPNPISLPRFTFILGQRDQGSFDLAKALVARDPEAEPTSRLEALCEAASVLWDGTFDQFTRLLAGDTALPDELRSLFDVLVSAIDDRVLAQIAIRRAESIIDVTADRLIYTDATWDFVRWFQQHWGRSSVGVLALAMRSVPDWFQGRYCSLALDDTPSRLAQLETEFGLVT